MIDVKTINRILLARRLYELACEHLKSEIDLSLSIGVNLLQDTVETFLVAIAAHVQADVGDRTYFDQYFDAINKKTGNTLPLRARLNDLNKLRVNSKHRGLAPAKSEVSDLPIIVKAFFEEVSSSILGCHFTSISLIDLMKDGEAKDLLIQASASFENGAYEECLVACRKAIYVKIESSYDILPFADGNPRGLLGGSIRTMHPITPEGQSTLKNMFVNQRIILSLITTKLKLNSSSWESIVSLSGTSGG